MKLAVAPIFPPAPAAIRPHPNPNLNPLIPLRRRLQTLPLNSHQYQTTKPLIATADDDVGIPIERVKILAKFKSRHNYIRVLQVSRSAEHPLAGSRLLLLDAPGNIHSMTYLFKSLTNSYFDISATFPPILPPGPLGILGFGGGSSAKIILDQHPETVIHGWELDPAVLSVAREYLGLEKLEKKFKGRLFINTGNALNASITDGFAGLFVDLFSKGRVIPELQDAATWEKLKKRLKKGGRMMVNVGGRCVEAEDRREDGGLIMDATLKAMEKVFPEELIVLTIDNRKDDSSIALTGKLPERDLWKKALRRPLQFYVDMWKPYR